MSDIVTEFRGVENLVYAEVLEDSLEKFTTGPVKSLGEIGEISKTTATATGTKYYSNNPMITINAEGEDTVTVSVPVLSLERLADITGKQIDEETGAFMDGESKPKYFALGYIMEKTDGSKRYVWRYKCSATIPDEGSKTKDNGTDSSGQSITFTGISTVHKFEKTKKSQKALVVDESDGKADLSTFFDQVTTCDTLKPKTA